MSGRLLEVIGGGASGGLLVRTGKDTKSAEHPDGRLAKGSLIAELELEGERLYYTRVSGAGPLEGWISTKLKGKDLLVEAGAAGSKLFQEEEEVKKAIAMSQAGEATSRGIVWMMPAGTRGDVQPMIALGVGLRKAGFRVRIITGYHGKEMAELCGLRFTEQGIDVEKWMKDSLQKHNALSEEERIEKKKKYEADEQAFGAEGMDEVFGNEEIIKEGARIINDLLKEETPDVVLAHILNHSLPFIPKAKCGSAVFNFEYVPLQITVPVPEEAVPQYQKCLEGFDKSRKWIKEEIGIDPMEGYTIDDAIQWRDSHLCFTTRKLMYGYEQDLQNWHALTRSEEWLESYFKGYLVLDPASQMKDLRSFGGIEGLRKLHDFINAGTKPIYIGFGSMPIPSFAFMKLFVAMKMTKTRAVVCEGWGGTSYESLKEEIKTLFEDKDPFGLVDMMDTNCLFVKVANHEWLFRRCAVAVHHGGAGTTSASMRAGVPTLILPFLVDQFFFGSFVQNMGIGGTLKLMENAEKLMDPQWSKLLRKLLTDKEIIAKSKESGDVLTQETNETIPKMIKDIERIIQTRRTALAEKATS